MINIRERDQIWNCPTNPVASDDGLPESIPSPGNGVNLPAPFPGLVTKELEDQAALLLDGIQGVIEAGV